MLSIAEHRPLDRSAMIISKKAKRCPISDPQYQDIRASHSALASSGCTKEFCQAGRAIHTDEPRIGENRALMEVELEAQHFLEDLHREGFFDNEEALQRRTRQALDEIRAGATGGIVRVDRSNALIGGNWTQTSRELEFGIRRAWRNARKCIMRSHCEELELCDLRTTRTSKQMAEELLCGIQKAFNVGSIQPTVFVFPPRTPNSRGPMILNHQILQFAGYETASGSVVGDPASVDVTKAIIELGWEPPNPRGRWDVLPLVTMADGDKPHIAELPADIRTLISIRHPHYMTEFERLDLKWVAFPALARLGFDIGGVQYTAAPFIGWFMDAEIGVRDLADSFRYNVLPDIVNALDLTKGRLNDSIEEFEDLPEYEKLALLSRAQAELNYAVHWSYLQAKVMMTDSLTASMKWCQYDDEFKSKNGFRLPADPYWLAPPQGSIIPLWHRGGAPNYQPKPMICRHVQDPVKAWRREQQRGYATLPSSEDPPPKVELVSVITEMPQKEVEIMSILPKTKIYSQPPLTSQIIITEIDCLEDAPGRSIAIYFCSAGTVAEKLATKLHKWTQKLIRHSTFTSLKPNIEPLNKLRGTDLTANKIILLVVSTTGQGDVPQNGSAFFELFDHSSTSILRKNFRFSIFGNGDSRYSTTFNGAATMTCNLMKRLGGTPLAGGLCNGDTALDPFPLPALKTWFTKLEPSITEDAIQRVQKPGAITIAKNMSASAVTVSIVPVEEAAQQCDDHQQQLLSTLKDATLISAFPEIGQDDPRSRLLDLSIGEEPFDEMSCIQILPINAVSKVQRVLLALQVEASMAIDFPLDSGTPSYMSFLTEFVDLELSFLTLDWLDSIPPSEEPNLTKEFLRDLSVLTVLERLHDQTPLPLINKTSTTLRRKILLDMPLLHTRTYSLASSPTYIARFAPSPTSPSAPHPSSSSSTHQQKISIMCKTIPTGRFSTTYLTDHHHHHLLLPSPLKYRLVDSPHGRHLRSHLTTPCIIVATGAGFGPVRAILQWRIATAIASGRTLPPLKHGVSLFLGLKECDVALTVGVINEALALELLDVVKVVVSNGEGWRVYDEVERLGGRVREKLLGRKEQGEGDGGWMFVCSNERAAEETRAVVGKVLGGGEEGWRKLGERYVEEVF